MVIALFLIARLLAGQNIETAAGSTTATYAPTSAASSGYAASAPQAESLCVALAALTQPTPAPDFVNRALTMLESTGWIAAHRFLFAGVRCHLLGWPRVWLPTAAASPFSSAAAPV